MYDAPKSILKLRKKKMIRPDLQWKVILGCVGVSLVITLVNAHIPLLGLWKFNELHGDVNSPLMGHMETVITTCFFVSIFLTFGLSIWLGTLLSFQFCGPIYAMKRYLLSLRDGTWGHECSLRKGDDLQDFKDALNGGVGALRQRIVAQHEALVAAERLLAGAKPGTPRAETLELIRVEMREFEIRFEDTESIESILEENTVPMGESSEVVVTPENGDANCSSDSEEGDDHDSEFSKEPESVTG